MENERHILQPEKLPTSPTEAQTTHAVQPTIYSEPGVLPQIEALQHELAQITTPIETTIPEVITGLPKTVDGPIGILQEKDMKKRQLRAKETSPKQYSEMLVVFNDTQLLTETDQEALGAFLKYVEANKDKITHLVANGDIADFSAQSFFDKDLAQLNSANDEIEAVRWLIDHLSTTLPNAKKVFVQGNHEARWSNMIDTAKGNEAWIRTLDEQFGLSENGWQNIEYGSGRYYDWHGRIFWHGHRSGAKSNVPKLEMEDAGTSVTTAHINRNMFQERVDARGNYDSGMTHGGFSRDNLGFMKKANTGWSQGFGVYFWDKKVGEQPYMVIMKHSNPRFIGPDGSLYDGTGFEIPGFEKPKRGRPRKNTGG